MDRIKITTRDNTAGNFMNIIGTGLSGLVGSRIVELLGSENSFEDISRKTGTNITDSEAVLARIKNSQAEVILHLAAYTNVDGAEEQKDLREESDAWKINVVGTENVVAAAEKTNKKLIYFSTDFIFDGENTPEGGYTENSRPNPINWYATTKHKGELLVQAAKIPWLIIRIAYPYRTNFEKIDFFRAIKNRLASNQPTAIVKDHMFCPTFVDDIAIGLVALCKNQSTGIYHMTGSQSLSPYEAAICIAEKFDLNTSLISRTTRAQYFANKAPRPFNLTMNTDKIKQLGISMRGFEEGLDEIGKQSNLDIEN